MTQITITERKLIKAERCELLKAGSEKFRETPAN